MFRSIDDEQTRGGLVVVPGESTRTTALFADPDESLLIFTAPTTASNLPDIPPAGPPGSSFSTGVRVILLLGIGPIDRGNKRTKKEISDGYQR